MESAPSQDDLERLAQNIGSALMERGWRIATAESCSGGWIAQCLTAIAGSSDWFEAGLVTYSNTAKINLLGVDAMVIERRGAVSGETAIAMAAGACRVTGADVAIAVTGIAGPDGGSDQKPVGTVWFGIALGSNAPRAIVRHFPGDRRDVRAHAVAFALRELAENLH